MTSQREAAWQAYKERSGATDDNAYDFDAGWDARDADVSALLEAARAVLESPAGRYCCVDDETHHDPGCWTEALRAALAAFPIPQVGNSSLVAEEDRHV